MSTQLTVSAKPGKSKIPQKYEEMVGARSSYLSRAQDYSKMTLPYILPIVAPSASAQNKHGYQGIGAEAVNHLANKVTSALFPVTEPFFSMDIDPDLEAELATKGHDKAKLTTYFNVLADIAMRKMNKLKMRPQLVNYQKHLIISGNSCLVYTDRGVKQLGLDRFVVKRSVEGTVLLGITCEDVSLSELPPSITMVIMAQNPGKKKDEIEKQKLYTSYELVEEGEMEITQCVGDVDVMEPKRIEAVRCPAIFGRWNVTSGEDYGRGLVEDHSGDFHVLEFLSEARARGCASMMDVKYLVRPGSLTDLKTLNSAPAGEFVQGLEEDIAVLQLDKFADHTFVKDVMAEYSDRIGRAFLMLQTQVRDSERTTAYEIQKIANEIDTSMGGNYSNQSNDLQEPSAIQLLDMIDPDLMEEDFTPLITTGLEALGRARELEKIMQYTELMAMPEGWPEEIRNRVNFNDYSEFVASQLSLTTTWLESEEKQAENTENKQIADATGQMGEALATGVGSAIGKRLGEGTLQ